MKFLETLQRTDLKDVFRKGLFLTANENQVVSESQESYPQDPVLTNDS